jgi:hypothetical protein
MTILCFSDVSNKLDEFDIGLLFTNDLLSKKYPFANNFKKIVFDPFIHNYFTDDLLDRIIMRQEIMLGKNIGGTKLIIFYYEECIKINKDKWNQFINSLKNYCITLVKLTSEDNLS